MIAHTDRSKSLRGLLSTLLLIVAIAGCGAPSGDAPSGAEEADEPTRIEPRRLDRHGHTALSGRLLEGEALTDAFSQGVATFTADRPFRQVSLMFDAPRAGALEWRARQADGATTDWRPVEETWSEEDRRVGRALLDRPADTVELRTTGAVANLYVEFAPEQTARTEGTLTRDMPTTGHVDRDPTDGFETTRQAEAPASLVIPREQWGARNPDKQCGRAHSPSRMTIHHTASPSDDGGDPAARMRQMQAFHIDNRGWCDIGYHFVVSQSGKIYQGRSTEKRTGAHVGGENYNNVGVSLIGNFENQTVSKTQFTAATEIVHWIHSTYNIALNRQNLKGHTEWPDQYTSCPGSNLKSRLKELANKAKNPGGNTTDWKVEITSKITGLENPYNQGSSQMIPDAFPGDGLTAEILVTNNSSEPLRDVWAGYYIETPYLEPTGYTIYSDHPADDRSSWSINDANAADANPADDKLGQSGKLNLYAFSPGETKRIVVDLQATEYSLGRTQHPDVRGWVNQIKDVYESKNGWSDTPQTDKVGKNLRTKAEIDILGRDEWHFNNTDTQENLEGWIGCCDGDYERLALNHKDGLMAMKVTQQSAQLISPEWTRIDADVYDQMVIRVRAHDGPHQKAIYWAREGESFSAGRALRFGTPGDGEFRTYLVPLGWHPEWSGTITRLRIDPLDDRSPGADAKAWYDIDGIYFQSTARQSTSASEPEFEEESKSKADPTDLNDEPIDEPDDGGSSEQMEEPDDEMETGGTASGGTSSGGNGSGGSVVSPRENARHIRVNNGCHAAGSPTPAPWLAGIALLALVSIRRPRSA